MQLASFSLLVSFLVAFVPLAFAGKNDGGTFCQSVDKLKVTSPLTFIRPVPSVNLKWDPKICLCQSEGELTDSTVDQLQKKIKQEGVKKLAKKLGLDSLPASWEELFVQQAVLSAAENFLDQYESCPRGCEYPKGAIPNSCKDCSYDCPKGQVKCNKKCQKPNKPCPSKTPKPPKTTTSDGYPTHPTQYKRSPDIDVVADEHYDEDEDEYTPASASASAPTTELDSFLSPDGTIDSEDSFNNLLDFVATATFGVRDIPEPTLIQQYYRSTNEGKCQPGWVPCAVLKKGKADWECTDVQSALDSCGGCVYPILPGPVGNVCSDIPGANEVACVKGHCKINSCQRGFAFNGTACEGASHKRYSLE